MCKKNSSFRQRLFAGFLAGEDEQSHERYKDKKTELFAGIHGRVLELGPGTGVNFPFFPNSIDWLGIEPNQAMHPHLRARAEDLGITVKFCSAITAECGVEDSSFDFVVSTLVLCSVGSVNSILKEIHRSLKPGGKFLFIEHVVDPLNRVRRIVQKIVPYTAWRYFSDGCDPGRDIADCISRAGFKTVDCRKYLQEGKGIINWVNKPHIYGSAEK